MTTRLTLTPEELADLTDRPHPKRQIEWLKRNNWTFEISAAGRPKVDRAYYQARMSGASTAASAWRPDWSKV